MNCTVSKVLKVIVMPFVVLSASRALAVETLTWDSFYRYGQTCGYECHTYAWQEVCHVTPEDYWCDLEQVCIGRTYVCYSYRLTLSDGDIIDFMFAGGGNPAGYEFQLRSASAVTWWKGMSFYRSGNGWDHAGTLSTQGQSHESGFLSATAKDNSAHIILSKAKFLGIHTAMYRLGDLQQRMSPGQRCTFLWQRD